MKFYVIYSFDACKGESVRKYQPRKSLLKVMDKTEGNEQYEYDHLEGAWEGGSHRKYVGLLTRAQFDSFIEDIDLYPEDCRTMGSITGLGWLPAISFNGDHYSAITNAYVTPIPEKPNGEERTEGTKRDWERVRKAVINHYS